MRKTKNAVGLNFSISYTELQKEVLNFFRSNEISILTGDPGTGKAQPLTSKVFTPNGYKLMGEIEIGDEVLTLNGKANVIGVYPQGELDIYKISFMD